MEKEIIVFYAEITWVNRTGKEIKVKTDAKSPQELKERVENILELVC